MRSLLTDAASSLHVKVGVLMWFSSIVLSNAASFMHLYFFYPMPHMSFTDFVVFPPRHGRSVTDFWGWDAHEARLRCPDDVSGDRGGCSARRALKPKFD